MCGCVVGYAITDKRHVNVWEACLGVLSVVQIKQRDHNTSPLLLQPEKPP